MNIRYPIYEGVYRILTFHPDFSRQGGTGKQPVICGGYPQTAGEE